MIFLCDMTFKRALNIIEIPVNNTVRFINAARNLIPLLLCSWARFIAVLEKVLPLALATK